MFTRSLFEEGQYDFWLVRKPFGFCGRPPGAPRPPRSDAVALGACSHPGTQTRRRLPRVRRCGCSDGSGVCLSSRGGRLLLLQTTVDTLLHLPSRELCCCPLVVHIRRQSPLWRRSSITLRFGGSLCLVGAPSLHLPVAVRPRLANSLCPPAARLGMRQERHQLLPSGSGAASLTATSASLGKCSKTPGSHSPVSFGCRSVALLSLRYSGSYRNFSVQQPTFGRGNSLSNLNTWDGARGFHTVNPKPRPCVSNRCPAQTLRQRLTELDRSRVGRGTFSHGSVTGLAPQFVARTTPTPVSRLILQHDRTVAHAAKAHVKYKSTVCLRRSKKQRATTHQLRTFQDRWE